MSRVLLHSLVFAPDGVSTAYLMTELAIELRRLGHEVTVLTTTPHYNLTDRVAKYAMRKAWGGLLYSGTCGGEIPVWHVKVGRKQKRLWKRAVDFLRFHIVSVCVAFTKLERHDVVIATSPPSSVGFTAKLISIFWRAPSVYKVAEVFPDILVREGVINNRLLIWAMERLEGLVYRWNTKIVAIAEQFKGAILKHGVPEEKILVIPDFVDTTLFKPMPRQNPFALQHGLADKFVVLYAGNIGLAHDWDSVLFAADKLSDLPITFVVVGDGARREWLGDEVKRRGMTNVTLVGYQPQELMPEINASCDVATIPLTKSGATGGFPSKVYTIMACGKPVIASAFEGSDMDRIITTAGCGRVVRPEDPQAYKEAVLTAFRQREALIVEGQSGRAFVEENFSKQAIARQYDSLIRHIDGKGCGPHPREFRQ